MFCVIWQVTVNILLSCFFLLALQSLQQNSVHWQMFFTFQGKCIDLWVTPPFLPGSLTPGDIKLPPKHSSGLFVHETLVESSCAQHRWKSACPGREAQSLDPWNFGSFFEQQEKGFLQVYLMTDQLVPKAAVPWDSGSIWGDGAGREAPRCSERAQQKKKQEQQLPRLCLQQFLLAS